MVGTLFQTDFNLTRLTSALDKSRCYLALKSYSVRIIDIVNITLFNIYESVNEIDIQILADRPVLGILQSYFSTPQ